MIDSQVHISVYNYHRVYIGETWRSILTVSHHDGFDHEVLLVFSRIFKSPVHAGLNFSTLANNNKVRSYSFSS